MRCKVHYKLHIQGLYICKDKVLKANKTFGNSNIKMLWEGKDRSRYLHFCPRENDTVAGAPMTLVC